MKPIQTDVSDEALITAIRANLCDFFRHVSRNNPAEHFENAQFTRWYTPIPHPWFNGVLSSNLPTKDTEAFIAETIQYFHNKDVSAFTWWLEPHLKPLEWKPALSKHGFGFSNDTPGMAVDLHALNESQQRADGFEIRVVEDEETLRTWAHIFIKGYGLPADWEALSFELWLNFGFDFPMRNYLGYLNGKPVSTSTLFYGGGTAGIYDVATLPEAREKGYRIGVLQASEMGFNIYKRLGFRHLCQIENFYLSL